MIINSLLRLCIEIKYVYLILIIDYMRMDCLCVIIKDFQASFFLRKFCEK